MLMGLAFLVTMILLYAGAIVLLYKNNIAADRRYYQIYYIGAMITLCVSLIALYGPILTLIDFVISLPVVAQILVFAFPLGRYELTFMILVVSLSNLFVLVSANAALVPIKFAVSRMRKTFEPSLRHPDWIIIDQFYHLDNDPVLIRKDAVIMSKWFKIMSKMILALLVVEVIAALLILYLDVFSVLSSAVMLAMKNLFILPAISYLLVEEIGFFLSGKEENQSAVAFESENITSKQIGDYKPLIEVYKKLLPNSFLADIESEKNAGRDTPYNEATKEQLEQCRNPVLLKSLIDQVRSSGVTIDSAFVDVLIRMIHQDSAIIVDPVTGSFSIYLYYYLNYVLASNGSVLFICEDSDAIDSYRDNIEKEFVRMNGVHPIWSIGTIEQARENEPLNVLICASSSLLEDEIFAKREEFFLNLKICIVLDSVAFFSGNNLLKRVLSDRLMKDKQTQFLFFSAERSRQLEMAIEHSMGKEIQLFDGGYDNSNSCVMIWKNEGYLYPQKVLGFDIGLSIGTALPLALIGAKYGAKDMNLLTSPNVPYHTYFEIMQQHEKELAKTFFKKSSIHVNEIIHSDVFASPQAKSLSFLIAYDSNNNLAAAINLWLRHGDYLYAMRHIIARPYLLREYFADKLDYFVNSPTMINSFASFELETSKSDLIAILIRLHETGMFDKELSIYAQKYGCKANEINKFLTNILAAVLPEFANIDLKQIFAFKEQTYFDSIDDKNEFVTAMFIQMTNADICPKLFERYRLVQTRIGTGKILSTLSIPQEDVHNYYLINQLYTYNGTAYQITDICDGVLVLKQTSPRTIPEYIRQMTIGLANYTENRKIAIRSSNKVAITTAKASVTRIISDYYVVNNGQDYSEMNNVQQGLLAIPVITSLKEVNILTICLSDDLGENEQSIALLFAGLLNEVFKTVFPHNYQNLVACSTIDKDWEDCLPEQERIILKTYPHAFFPDIREGCEVHIIELSHLDYGLIGALVSNLDKLFDVLLMYLRWATDENNHEKAAFLRYGFKEYPSFVNLPLITTLIEDLCSSVMEMEDSQLQDVSLNAIAVCSFCGEAVFTFGTEFDDGRICCNNCDQYRITQREEIEKVFKAAKEFLEKDYKISIPSNITVKFKTAKSIRKEMRHSGDGRVLGFYSHSDHEVWIESGGPRVCTQSIIIHELTHCWQHDQLDISKLTIEKIEGHSTFVEIEALERMNEPAYARMLEQSLEPRDDEYGKGFRYIRELMKDETRNVFEVMRTL